jgi:phospholipid/cholesterol/gamma-HCH transport system permease protein
MSWFTWLLRVVDQIGQLTLFGLSMSFAVVRGTGRDTVSSVAFGVGAQSVFVIAVTGCFIGMVLAVQSYGQFAQMGMATRMGSIINISVIREFGPVLAAVMLAGRVGGSMAAEVATMKITEQLDALACLGVNPVHYLGGPRLAACVLMIPLLTIVANFMGVLGGATICIWVYQIDSHHYWQNARGYVGVYDLVVGLIKPMVFGGTIAVVSCHTGFQSEPGAEGVGRAATRAFVLSFLLILIEDFLLALGFNQLYDTLWPQSRGLL